MSRLARSLLLLAAVAAGCAGPPRVTTQADLERRLAANPDDGEALRDLGTMLALSGDYPRARVALERAVTLRPQDGRALYLLGLTSEALGPPPVAEAVFARYPQIPAADAYRDSLRGRYDAIVRTRLRTEFAAALAADTLGPVDGATAIGVLPFAYRGTDPQYTALGRGLAEVLSSDLATVGGLTIVERVRLDALLAEYDLARSGQTDSGTVPRAGGLLRADRLVGGEVGVAGDALRLDAAVWSATPDSLAGETSEGVLAELFRLQRELTLGVFSALGVTLTSEQRTRLDTAPTTDLTAFMLFSRGLLEEDGGRFQRATDLYEEALARDPSFRLAAQRRAEASLAAASARAAAVAINRARPRSGAEPLDLVARRADAIDALLRPTFAPAPDVRDPTIEGNTAGILGDLPDPPPPPSTGGTTP